MWPLGAAMVAAGLPALASGAIGAYSGEPEGRVLLASGLLLTLAGFALYRRFYTRIRMHEAIMSTVAIWILTPLMGSLPYLILHIPFIDAVFESVSAWTTTGLTIFTGGYDGGLYVPMVEELPESFKWLRTLTQWEGGLGIVVFTVAVLAPPGVSVAVLYLAEGKFERLEASLKRTAMLMGWIYVVLTLVAFILFYAAGMPAVDALHHAMTGVATAGFSTHSESLGYYHTLPVLAAGMIVVMLGAVSFNDHYNILRLRLGKLRESVELKAQLALLALFSLAGLALWVRDPVLREAMEPVDVVFNIVSTSATAGFQSSSLAPADPGYKMLLAVASLIGGSAFSTAGGIKVLRVLVALKAVSMEASRAVHPAGYKPNRRLGKYVLDEDLLMKTLATTAAMLVAYTLLTIAMTIAVPGYSLEDVMLEVASAMGNVGVSSGITGATAPASAKIILIAAMLLGRLEVITYIMALHGMARELLR